VTRWDNLNVFQLREFGRYLDWAEHHAMHEFGAACEFSGNGMNRMCESEVYSNKVKWKNELKTLAETQVQIRDLEVKRKMEAA
jgi:hypothetical protein